MKKFFVPLLLCALMLTACAPVISNAGDEIRLNSWSASLKNGSRITLSFSADNANFVIDNKDGNTKLSGLCVIDGDELMICNQSDGEPYIFGYTLKGNKLILKYGEGELKLKRNNFKRNN